MTDNGAEKKYEQRECTASSIDPKLLNVMRPGRRVIGIGAVISSQAVQKF